LQDILRQMAGAEPSEVKKVADNIRRWYMEDIKLIPDTVDRSLTTLYDIEVVKKLQNIQKELGEILAMIRIQNKPSS
jgi:hypothetical protein